MKELIFLSPREALAKIHAGALLIDLRDDYFKNGRYYDVGEIVSIFYKEFPEKYRDLPKDRLLILADYVGIHSKELGFFLLSQGYEQVASLVGGIVDWVKDGMPTIIECRRAEGGCACQQRKGNASKNE